jgi:hypothetical protein
MYQLHGSSTSVFLVGGEATGRGFIQDVAETSGEKFICLMGGVEGRKYGSESWWVREVSCLHQFLV